MWLLTWWLCSLSLLPVIFEIRDRFFCLFESPVTPEEQVQSRKLCLFITESFAGVTELTQVLLLSIIMYTENMWWCSLAPGLAYKFELREAEAVPPPISVWSPAHLHLAWVCRASSSSCHHFTCKDSTFELRSMECNTEQCSLLTGEWPKRLLLQSSRLMWDSEISPQVAWPTWLWPPANTVLHPTQTEGFSPCYRANRFR